MQAKGNLLDQNYRRPQSINDWVCSKNDCFI